MSYCTKCGKQNPDTAKFCTGCGTNLAPAPGAYLPPEPQAPLKKTNYKLFGAIAAFALALTIGAYFLFIKNDKSKIKAASETTPPIDTTLKAENYTAVNASENNIREENETPKPVTLSNGDNGTDLSISEAEKNAVSQKLRNFYECENNEDIVCLLNNYKFPINRYYQLYNVGYDKMYSLIQETFTTKLVYHHITIKWDYSTVEKIPGGFKAVLNADFEFRRSATPDEYRSRSIQIIIFMDDNYKITTIYENQ